MSSRGDMDAILESMKSYFKDKKAYPWHRIHKTIESEFNRSKDKEQTSNWLVLVRDAVFGALGLLSVSLILDIPTSDILSEICKADTWIDCRRRARAFFGQSVAALIESGKTKHIVASGLKRDSLGYLVPELIETDIEAFKKAKPVGKKGTYSLKRLLESRLGRALLKEQFIIEDELEKDDPRIEQLLEAYEHRLLDIELEEREDEIPADTFQVTLHGEPMEEVLEEKPETKQATPTPGVQIQITEYVGVNDETPSPPKKRKKRMRSPGKKGRSKKTTSKKGGKK